MPHSEAFNARRREAYRLARQAGLNPRDAGHVYNSGNDLQRKLAEWRARPVAEAPIAVPSPRQRTLDALGRTDLDPRVRSAFEHGRLVLHNYYQTYVKVRVRTKDSDGNYHRRSFTVAFRNLRMPSRGEVMDRAQRFIDQHRGDYPEDILSVSFDVVEQVPDTAQYQPSREALGLREAGSA